MLRISKLTDYGIVLLAQIARGGPNAMYSARTLSVSTGIASPTVEKLLKQMVRADLLISKRGANGGYLLSREPVEISLAFIIDLMQGSIALTECTDSTNTVCDVAECCGLRDHWPLINNAVRAALNAVTLQDLASNVGEAFQNSLSSTGSLQSSEA